MFSKKSCLSCAFCLHCRDTFISTLPVTTSHWQCDENNLTEEEVLKLKKSDISFLSDAQRKRDEWVKTYEEKEQQYNQKIQEANKKFRDSPLGKLIGKDTLNMLSSFSEQKSLSPFLGNNPYPHWKEFGMEPCPTAPDYEYLKCWKEIWGEDDENIWKNLKKKRCSHYYPLSKRETKTLQACDEECKEKKENKKNRKNLIYSFLLGCVATLIGVYVSYRLNLLQKFQEPKTQIQKNIQTLCGNNNQGIKQVTSDQNRQNKSKKSSDVKKQKTTQPPKSN